MTVYLPHVKLANITPGSAEVRLFTPCAPDVPFGSSERLGHVARHPNNRWAAYDDTGSSVGGWFRSRKEAAAYLKSLHAIRQLVG